MRREDFDSHDPHIAALRRKYLPIVVANITVFVLTVGAYFWIKNFEDRTAFEQFSDIASEFAVSVGNTKNGIWQRIYAAKDSSIIASQSAFDDYARQVITDYPAIEMVAWLPQIAYSDIAAFEKIASDTISGDFRLVRRNSENQVPKVEQRDSYSPVYLSYPGKEPLYGRGYDFTSTEGNSHHAADARVTNRIVASNVLDGSTFRSDDKYIQLLLHLDFEPGTDNSGDKILRSTGMILAVINVNKLIAGVNDRFEAKQDIEYLLVDRAEDGKIKLLDAWPPINVGEIEATWSAFLDKPHFATGDNVGGRRWEVLCRPSQAFLDKQSHVITKSLVALGLVMMLVFALYLYELKRHLAGAEDVAAKLRETKATLKKTRAALDQCQSKVDELTKQA